MESPRKSHIPSSPPQVAGIKRPATALLPAFEPLSSSPIALPRPAKRQALSPALRNLSAAGNARLKYPTPVPTSSTGIISSSPPCRAPISFTSSRPEGLNRGGAQPGGLNAEQRAPLSAVPCVGLSENGERLLMGRSSNSSHYQLSSNRLISRVHVEARYIPPPTPLALPRVEIVCTGWNGLKLHSQGRTWELLRGDSFTSETEGTEILIDVQDARVMVQWPRRTVDASEDDSWEDSPRPVCRRSASLLLQSSPLRRSMAARIGSPVSPSPATLGATSQRLQALIPLVNDAVVVYEDNDADEAVNHDDDGVAQAQNTDVKGGLSPHRDTVDQSGSILSELDSSFSSDLSDLDDKDPDAENDPIMHSFGPFGTNLAGRLASITATPPPKANNTHHPKRRLQDVSRDIVSVLAADDSGPDPDATLLPQPEDALAAPAPVPPEFDTTAIQNHAANQLAYSRLSSTPISTILSNLPAAEKRNGELTKDVLKTILDAMPCVGAISRQGKDAAGKALESEYYYMPEKDTDDDRRSAVVSGLGRPSLRNCRKQHKVGATSRIFSFQFPVNQC